MTKTVRHTPPTLDWHAVPSHVAEGPPEVRHADGWLVCETCSDSYASLMAAAPDMADQLDTALIWLRAALDCKEWHWDGDQYEAAEQTYAAGCAALAKAGRPR